MDTPITPTLTLEYAGRCRQLSKHPTIAQAVRSGRLSAAGAARRPWYLRLVIAGRERLISLRTSSDRIALRRARDLLAGKGSEDFSAWLAARDARRGLTLGDLAASWLAAGLPLSPGRPRGQAAAQRLRRTLARCLPWWAAHPAASVTPQTMESYAVHRRAHLRPGARHTGGRSLDLELGCLSCLCSWATLAGHLDRNPYAVRSRYGAVDVVHCHRYMPGCAADLHRILAWFWAPPADGGAPDVARFACGAWLALTALTGLRPGEPGALQYLPVQRRRPAAPLPGHIYRSVDRSWYLHVHRSKFGQNPVVRVHADLRAFVGAWRRWLRSYSPHTTTLFPRGGADLARRLLSRACTSLSLPPLHPHGLGRAYYVRVRRSQGASDLCIAGELGQSTAGALIRSVYGEPADSVGGGTYAWTPSSGAPAWSLLAPPKK